MTNDNFSRLRVCLAAVVPDGKVGLHELCEEIDVSDGQPQRVDLGQPLLVGQRGDVRAEALEGVVDGLHPSALAHVGSLSELLHLHLRPHPPSAFQQRPAVLAHLRGQLRGAVGAAVRKPRGGGGGGEGQVADVVVSMVTGCLAVVFAVIVLEVTGEKVHIVIQKVVSIQGGVSGRVVCKEVVIVEVRRRREGVERGERLEDAVHVQTGVLACSLLQGQCFHLLQAPAREDVL